MTKNVYFNRHQKLSEGDVFIGFDKDTVASVVLQVTEKLATIPKYQQKQSSEEKQEDTKDREIDEEKVQKFDYFHTNNTIVYASNDDKFENVQKVNCFMLSLMAN